ncbi:MAG: carboxypeptidase regulatory-like domain-containing protein [Terriglobales bacterium]
MTFRRLALFTLLVTCVLAASTVLLAQTTVGQGSIQGTITDPSGAVVGGAKITITHKDTAQVISQTSTNSGTYNSGGLIPGDYTLRVEAKGFRTAEQAFAVQVGVTSSGNIKLEVGEASQVVEVQASSIQVNTEQSTVQGVITGDQIDKLPVDGRNFLDLAQLEPGVQIQDGQTFDPTKAGYSSISINGVFGRTPRIELDGVDISDETVGTTTQNVGMSSIQEFNISRSNLDLSTELTSAGAVNVTTRSGSNDIHGQAFYNFRGRDAGTASFPGAQVGYYQRNNFGGRVGGPIIKDKLFFFIDGERMKQDGLLPLVIAAPFSQLSGGFLSPFRDSEVTGKLDWQASKNIHVFYRFTYNWNKSEANFGYNYQVYSNRDNTPSDAAGVDINQGSWSHSFRFGYLKFHNLIGDSTAGASFYNPIPGAEIDAAGIGNISGPNLLAPQQTYQSNKQIKYDGSKVYGSHVFRFGIGFNDINGGGFASFFGIAPLDVILPSTGPINLITGATSGAVDDPTAYPLVESILGNGQGFFTEKPNFGYPAGGQRDHRFQFYLGDSWKMKPNFTVTYGLRYNRDTGRSDSDLASIPCSVVAAAIAPCSGSTPLLDQFGPGLGAPVKQPNTQFGPQVGFAWDPTKKGKTVIRAGAGIYYENSIFNNTLFDRPPKLATGLFFQDSVLGCGFNGFGTTSFQLVPGNVVTSINGKDLATQVCGQPLSVSGPLVFDLQQEYQAAVKAQGASSNPGFVGNTLQISTPLQGLAAFDPNFRNARSYQFNVGMQHEIWKGGVLTADYIRNVSTRFMLTIDQNHVGDARFLSVPAANAAIATTLTDCGAATIAASYGAACPTDPGNGTNDGGTYQPRPATINDYAGHGLDSGNIAGGPANLSGFAFGGINRNVGPGDFEMPEGRSTYNALQMSYKQQLANPMPGFTSMNMTIAYTLSRFVGDGGNDQFFSATAVDFNNPSYFTGPTSLDRTDAFKFGITGEIAHHGPRLSVIGNFGTAHPSTPFLLAANGGSAGGVSSVGEIYRTDLTGDGTVQDIFPTAAGEAAGKPGQFGRSVSPTGLANLINSWNSTSAGTLTPAGQALVGAGLMTTADLQGLGGVKPFVAPPPAGAVGNGIFREVSTTLAWPIKLTERFSLEPSFSAFNVFNLANFGIEGGSMPNQVTPFAPNTVGTAGNVNGTALGSTRESLRVGTGSGVFSLGAPRQVEWGIRLNF